MARLVYLKNVTTLRLDPGLCVGCGVCVTVCPRAVLEMLDTRARIVDSDLCMECGACATNCATRAITVRAGVGCAAAVMSGAMGGRQACCSSGLETMS